VIAESPAIIRRSFCAAKHPKGSVERTSQSGRGHFRISARRALHRAPARRNVGGHAQPRSAVSRLRVSDEGRGGGTYRRPLSAKTDLGAPNLGG
jgi:hypothetical protein